ncbi:MAG: FadR family transcriptional regulator [Cohaesibacter sp.]|jgi:GntR family transcriptional repressor for pyruvate dehydrogenase complex|nr:FadR family transcriptional regulator [Cohaesibacter sp.]
MNQKKIPSPIGPFEAIGHESVAKAVVEQIETMIMHGILKEGRKLPSERELAESMQVSRPKLREALQHMEKEGLITVKHGEGAFVAKLIGSAMSPALLNLYTRHGDAFYDYLEYRREQEGFASRLAAKRATSSDKDRLKAIMDKLQTSWETGDEDASSEADFQFHAAVVDASQNTTLIHMMASIYELTRHGLFYNREFLRSIDGSGKRLLEQHLAIGNAILEGDAEKAEEAARAHIDFVEESFRHGQEQSIRETRAQKRKLLA